MSRQPFDVCIIGGGPAGAVCAAQLALFGLQVQLFAKPVHRTEWPETSGFLLRTLLEQQQLGEALKAATIAPLREKSVQWGTQRTVELDGSEVLIDRQALSRALRAAAAASGATITAEAAGKPSRLSSGLWSVPFANGSRKVLARYVVLAGGRRAQTAGADNHVSGRRIAAYYGTCSTEMLRPAHMVVGKLESAWYWAVRSTDRTTHVILFADPRTRRGHSVFTSIPMFGGSDLRLPIRFSGAIDATARASTPIGTAWMRVGDSSLAVDPLSSMGVYLATLSAAQAARVIHTTLSRPSSSAAAESFYRRSQADIAEHCTQETRTFMEHDGSGLDGPSENRQKATAVPLDNLRLAEDVRFEPVPIILGNYIESVPGVVVANRPFAFIEGYRVSELVAPLKCGKTLTQTLALWTIVPVSARFRILQSLIRNQIIRAPLEQQV